MELFTWNAPVVDALGSAIVDKSVTGLEATAGALNISDIIQPFNYDKSSSVLLLIKRKSKDLQSNILM